MSTGCYAKPTPPNCGFFHAREFQDDFCPGVDRLCFFFEDLGKDPNEAHGKRWRVVLYYASHLAITKLFPSEESKNTFLASLKQPATA